MTDVLAVANQKGGVAKTTTVHSLGVASAELGRRTLVVDLDPQACLTFSLGFDPDPWTARCTTCSSAGTAWPTWPCRCPGWPCSTCCRPPSTWPAPRSTSSPGPAGSTCWRGRSSRCSTGTTSILIDCPPSLGVLTINGLTAANAVLIPLQCEALSHRGVGQLLETIEDVRAFANSELTVRGIIATMYDDRTKHSRHIIEEVEARYGIPVLQPPVRKSIRFAEAPARGKSILQHAPNSPGRRGLSPAGPHPARDERGGRHRWLVADGPDPLGKRALYWMPVDEQAVDGRRIPSRRPARPGVRPTVRPAPAPPCPTGRQARPVLRGHAGRRAEGAGPWPRPTDPLPRRGVLAVACSSCGSVTRVGRHEFLSCSSRSAPGCPVGRSTGG